MVSTLQIFYKHYFLEILLVYPQKNGDAYSRDILHLFLVMIFRRYLCALFALAIRLVPLKVHCNRYINNFKGVVLWLCLKFGFWIVPPWDWMVSQYFKFYLSLSLFLGCPQATVDASQRFIGIRDPHTRLVIIIKNSWDPL